MKKSFLFAAAAVLFAATSCEIFKNSLNGQEVKVDETANVTSKEFVGLKGIPSAALSFDKKDIIEIEAGQITENVSLGSTFSKTLEIKGESLPEIVKPMEGSAENAGIAFTVKNPLDKPVLFEAKVKIDDLSEEKLPVFEIPAASTKTVFIGKKDKDIPCTEKPDEVFAPSILQNDRIGGKFNTIDLFEFKVSEATKGAAPAAASGDFTISAKYCSALVFPKGTKITIHRSFHDMNLNLDRLSEYMFDKYDVYLTITNPLPFEIQASAKNEDGITANSQNAAKAGTPENPVKSSVVLRVEDKSGLKVNHIESADLTLVLTSAKDGAELTSSSPFEITVDKIVNVK